MKIDSSVAQRKFKGERPRERGLSRDWQRSVERGGDQYVYEIERDEEMYIRLIRGMEITFKDIRVVM